jgi:hypothetical protein
MFMITKAVALAKQAEQVEYYAALYGDWLRKTVADATTADALEDGPEYDMVIINRHIPRGGAIERMIPAIVEREAEIARRFAEQMAQEREDA